MKVDEEVADHQRRTRSRACEPPLSDGEWHSTAERVLSAPQGEETTPREEILREISLKACVDRHRCGLDNHKRDSLVGWCENPTNNYVHKSVVHVDSKKCDLWQEYAAVPPATIVVHSSLNGNNGEWTNTDDMDPRDRQRARRAARNHQRHQQHGDAADGHRPERILRGRELGRLRAIINALNHAEDHEQLVDLFNGAMHVYHPLVNQFGPNANHERAMRVLGHLVAHNDLQNLRIAIREYRRLDDARAFANADPEVAAPGVNPYPGPFHQERPHDPAEFRRNQRPREPRVDEPDDGGVPEAAVPPARAHEAPRVPVDQRRPEVHAMIVREARGEGLVFDEGFIGPVYYGVPRNQQTSIRLFFKDPDFNNGLFMDWRNDLRIIGGGVLLATAFSLFHVPMVLGTIVTAVCGVGTNEVAARTSQFVRICLHDSSSDSRFDTVLTGRPFDDDAHMHLYRITTLTSWHSHFWAARGYTHYADYPLPAMFLENTPGSASQVLAQCATEVGLVGIAKGTFGRDEALYRRFVALVEQSGGWQVEGVKPMFLETWNHYTSVAAFYLAQRQMVHNHEVHLLHGRMPQGPPPGFTGSSVNFRFGIIRLLYEEARNVEPWTDNGRFVVVASKIRGRRYRHRRIEPQLWREQFGFSRHDHVKQKALRSYRTQYLSFHSNSIVYARTTHNLESALCRMFQARDDEFELQANQRAFFTPGNRRHHKCIAQYVSTVMRQFSMSAEYDELLGVKELASRTHIKKGLRQQAEKELYSHGVFTQTTYASRVSAKVKIETAKVGKNARVYVDMTTPQSLLGGWLVDPLKEAQAVVDLGWCVFKFVAKTDEASVQAGFEFLRENKHRPCILYHSDDAVVSLPCADGVLIFNLDIKSCDRSNLKPIFDLLVQCVPEPFREYFVRMTSGCLLDMMVRNPEDPGEYFKVRPLEEFEYSGVNITTVINNCALFGVGLSIFIRWRSYHTKAETVAAIPQRVKSAGYQVTVQVCDVFQQVQFLKFSPSCENLCLPIRNLGCILRALGHCDGDLKGSKRESLVTRARRHLISVVLGLTSGYVDPVGATLRNVVVGQSCDIGISPKYQYTPLTWSKRVGDGSFLSLRYGLNQDEVEHMKHLVSSIAVGSTFVSPVLDRIYSVDYG